MRNMRISSVLFALAISGSVYAQGCPDPEFACPYFGDMLGFTCAFNGNACEGDDCKGANFGEEFKTVPAGKDFKTWMAMHEGAVSVAGYFMPCNLTLRPGVTRVDVPDTACAFSLITDTTLYMEHFVSNPEASCMAWLECPCELPE